MNVATIQLRSQALERTVTFTVLLPNPAIVGPGPYDVLVQLHGYHDDHTAWLYKSRLWNYAEKLPLIVVLPDGQNGWWSNFGRGRMFEDMVAVDIRNYVLTMFPTRQGNRWAIGGLSMGGFGAIRLGLKHPGKFCSIFAHSSKIAAPEDEFVWSDPRWSQTLQDELRTDLDCYRWANEADRQILPRLSFDCGTEDFLLEDNRRFHAYLEQIDLPHTYTEYPGEHTWDYWDTHIQTALRQHADVLGIKPVREAQADRER